MPIEEDKTLTELPQATLPLAPSTLVYLVQDADTIPRSVQAPAGALAALLSDVVIGTTDGLPEGTANLYFTNSRADLRIAGALALLPPGYNDANADARVVAGLALHLPADEHTQYHNDARALTWLGTRTTDDLAEGAGNLYYTDARADLRIDAALALLPAGYDDADADARVAAGLALHIPADEHGQYHNDARALSWLGGRTTSDLAEGSRLYYTDVRADARIALAHIGPTLTAPVTLTGVVGSSALTINGATQTASFPVLNATQTWNNVATAFVAIKLNVTDTASAAASKLLELRTAGAAMFTVDKAGNVSTVSVSASGVLSAGTNVRTTSATGQFYWSASSDLFLNRDGAGILAIRNGANAQTLRVYGTYTDASNYERASLSHVTGTGVLLAAQTAGSGAANQNIDIVTAGTGKVSIITTGGAATALRITRTVATNNGYMDLQSGNATNCGSLSFFAPPNTAIAQIGNSALGLSLSAFSGTVSLFGNSAQTVGAALQLTEMTAPAAGAANTVRLFAVDNGAGKTKLMAQFATGAAVQLAIEP